MTALSIQQSVLLMEKVTVQSGRSYDTGVWNLNLSLSAGELALIRLERSNVRVPIADAAEGLAEVGAGSVAFMNEDWSSMSPRRAGQSRGRIGRVFEGHGWFHGLDVSENMMLAQYHHTSRSKAEIADEAAGLSDLFGLPGLPRSRHWQTHPHDLRRAACARAFMGKPDLILLEEPTAGICYEIIAPLMAAIRRARTRGAAILWTTTEAEVWNDAGIRPSQRLIMSGSQMLAARN
jgi:phospholipid/cholesterol/gamma-HCH transport system ATP-binding protein